MCLVVSTARLLKKGNVEMAKSWELWMADVESVLENTADVSSLDIPDYDYSSDYEDGRSSTFAANAALTEAGMF